MTDRLHTAGAGLFTTTTLAADVLLGSRLAVNYNREQFDVLVDVARQLTLRGGYRYVWGDAQAPAPLLAGGGEESSELRQQFGLAGINLRLNRKISFNADFEGASTSHVYFRTSLYNYQKLRISGRYQVTARAFAAG